MADAMADRILELSRRRDMPVRKMAYLSGIPETSLYAITSRRGTLSAMNIAKLCRGMGVSADWMLGLDDLGNCEAVERGGPEIGRGDGSVVKLVLDMWGVITSIPVPSSELGDIPERVFELMVSRKEERP